MSLSEFRKYLGALGYDKTEAIDPFIECIEKNPTTDYIRQRSDGFDGIISKGMSIEHLHKKFYRHGIEWIKLKKIQ
tara:strand:+ start:16315 stop:16542 length:228 start_codon:yes stop_codon:yes gene_type:complete